VPFYIYRCDICREEFEIRHGMFYVQERCIKCNAADSLFKLPAFSVKKGVPTPSTRKPGQLVDEYIKDTKEEIKKEKKRLKTEKI